MGAYNSKYRQEILEEIEKKAPYYVPEWRYNSENPDAGAALALLWADMYSGVLERFDKILDYCALAFFDGAGIEALQGQRAEGWLCFEAEGDDVFVPAGTAAASADKPEAVLQTTGSITAAKARLTDIYCTMPSYDICRRYASLENIRLFEITESGRHIWTFNHSYAFSQRGGSVLCLKSAMPIPAVLGWDKARWEYSDSGGWRSFDRWNIEGGSIFLRFPDEEHKGSTAIRFTLDGAGNINEKLGEIRAFPAGRKMLADGIFAGDVEINGQVFYPFDKRFYTFQSLYISSGEAFEKAGARVEISFFLTMERDEITEYPRPEMQLKEVMKKSELIRPVEYEIRIGEVAWEYFNGTGWASIKLEDSRQAREVFSSEGGKARECKIIFICPNDMKPFIWGGSDTLFIRARILAVENFYQSRGCYLVPKIEGLSISYSYENGIEITKAHIEENHEKREESLSGGVSLAGRISEDNSLYFAFDGPITKSSVLIDSLNSGENPELEWEYYSGDGWERLDIIDGSEGFHKTAVAEFSCLKEMSPLFLLGKEARWIRAVDKKGLYSSPAAERPLLKGIYENAVHALAVSPGEASNMKAYGYSRMLAPLNGVKAVFNPLPAAGGCNGEKEERLVSRSKNSFYHGNKAISGLDLELLALDASPSVLRCRYFSRRQYNANKRESENLLVVLADEASRGEAAFTLLQKRISAHIEKRRPLGYGRAPISVCAPNYIRVNVDLNAAVLSLEHLSVVKNAIYEQLRLFFNPLSGGLRNEGWNIGEMPTVHQISLLLQKAEGLGKINYLSLSLEQEVGGIRIPLSSLSAESDAFAYPINGSHRLELLPEGP